MVFAIIILGNKKKSLWFFTADSVFVIIIDSTNGRLRVFIRLSLRQVYPNPYASFLLTLLFFSSKFGTKGREKINCLVLPAKNLSTRQQSEVNKSMVSSLSHSKTK